MTCANCNNLCNQARNCTEDAMRAQAFNRRVDAVLSKVPTAFRGPRLSTIRPGPVIYRCGGDPDRIVWRGVLLAFVAFVVILWVTK